MIGSKLIAAVSGRPKPALRQPPGKPGLGAPPPAAAPVTGQKPEFDAAYYGRVNIANHKEEQGLSDLNVQEGNVKQDFGIEDTTDPFSRANAQKRMFLAKQKAASASLASRGQLYSGSHERALQRTRYEEEAARAELRKQYEAAINQIGSARAGVKFNTEEERAQAFEDWLARAPDAAEVPVTDAEAEASPDTSASSGEPVHFLRPGGPTMTSPGPQAGATLVPTGEQRARQTAQAKRAQTLRVRKNEITARKAPTKADIKAPSSIAQGGGGGRTPARHKTPPRAVAHRGGRIR